MEQPCILKVDRAFTPDKWVGPAEAVNLISRGIVMTSLGETVLRLRGGNNAVTGRQSVLEVGSILVVDTKGSLVTDFSYAPYSRRLVFSRDRGRCAYCSQVFRDRDLTMDHVFPKSRGGKATFCNSVSACGPCNRRKGARTPEEAGMPLVYLPYAPSRFEYLILAGRNVLACQMDFLSQRLPRHSRLLH